jgi:class 3 adenylate cyclase
MSSSDERAASPESGPTANIRKLTAIAVADMVAYSRSMKSDEDGTFSRLRSLRDDIITPLLSKHGGRIFSMAGDAFLMDFSSAVEAVRCSLAILRRLEKQRLDGPSEQQVQLRIGIHLGDALVDGEDLKGDAVNIASRLESHAKAGWLCISSAVYDQVHNKIDSITFTEMAPQELKNMGFVRAYLGRPSTSGLTSTPPAIDRESSEQLIAIGPDLIAVAEIEDISNESWRFHIHRFVLGDMQALVAFVGSFESTVASDRYILSTELGDGRALSAAPSLDVRQRQFVVSCAVHQRSPRLPAAALKAEWAMSRRHDLVIDKRGNIALVSGLAALPQRITSSLSLQRGESPAYPEAGSKLGQHFRSVDRELRPKLIQLDIIRLAAIPITDATPTDYPTSLHCVDRVRSVAILGESHNGWLPVRIELDVNGAGLWSQEISFLLGRHVRDSADDKDAVARLSESLPAAVSSELVLGLARECPDGLGRKIFQTEDLQRLVPRMTSQEVDVQVHLLEAHRLVTLVKFLGGQWHLKLMPAFYEQVDPEAIGSSPVDDAKSLILHMLNNETGQAAALHKASGWDRRRFNPAYRCVMDNVPISFISQERSPLYPCVSILWKPEVRAALTAL